MILVTGGTGRLGRALVGRLTRGGSPVRVLTRNPTRAAGFDRSLVEVVTGDVRDPRAVDTAVRGARVVVSAVHGLTGRGSDSPTTVDVDGNRLLVEAARRHAVEQFVLVSVQGAGPRHPLGLARAEHVAEQAVRAAGIPATIIRPTAFAELWLHLVGEPLVAGGAARVFGRGRDPVAPAFARQAGAAVVLDTADLTFDASAYRRRYPSLPLTPIAEVPAASSVRWGRAARARPSRPA